MDDFLAENMDRVIAKKKGLKRKHWFYIVGVVVFLTLVLIIIFGDYTSTYKVEKDKLTIAEIKKGQFNDYILVIGKVEPIATVYLDAIDGGRVEEILIEEGTMVKKGDVILRLSNQNINLNILNSEAQLAEKENFLRNTLIIMEQQKIQLKRELLQLYFDIQKKKRTYEQNTMLLKDELIPRENYLESKESYEHVTQLRQLLIERARQDSIYRKIEIENMNDNLDNIRQNLKMVRERLENLNVKVSVDGQLGMLDAELGQSIGTGHRIGQINVLTDFKIEAQINEHYIDRVRRDLTASFDRQGKSFFLKVKKVYPEVREGLFNIDLVFTSEKPHNIRTGQTNHIRLQLGQPEEATLIPRGGFFQSTGGQWVYVLDETERYAMKRNIRIGRQNPQYFELLDGLEPGEKVITSSYDTFGENDRLILR